MKEEERIRLEQVLPGEIEAKSFEIIGKELEEMGIFLNQEERPVVMRAIHATADFDYARNLVFSKIVSSGRKFTFVPVFLDFPITGRSPSSSSITGLPLSYLSW